VRTYHKLENYHWEEIKDAGLEKDKKVWVGIINSWRRGVVEGIVDSFDIHFEGEIEVNVQLKKESSNEWDANPKEYDLMSTKVFKFQVYDTKEQAEAFLRTYFRNTITRLNESVKHYTKELDKLTV
jgi:hypothetical protein